MAINSALDGKQFDAIIESTATANQAAHAVVNPDGSNVGGSASQPQVSDSATTSLVTVTTGETTVTASTGQQGVTITSLGSGKVFYAFDTGVSSSNAFLSKGDQLVVPAFADEVFLTRSSGSSSVQIDRFIKS